MKNKVAVISKMDIEAVEDVYISMMLAFHPNAFDEDNDETELDDRFMALWTLLNSIPGT